MKQSTASRTAVLVCQGRAVADGRICIGRFEDPIATHLLSDDERAAVERARTRAVPDDWRERIGYESLRANAEVIVPRTVVIDDAIRERLNPQLVVLGAGLDTRAWRMRELAAVDVFEVDQPASQGDKRSRLGDLEPVTGSLTFVPVDLSRDSLAGALDSAGHEPTMPTTWIWEGVVPYLRREDVLATVNAIAQRSPLGSRLVVNYQTPSPAATIERLGARALSVVSRGGDPMADEPRRSSWTPDAMRALLAGAGMTVVRDDDLFTLATRIATPDRHVRSLRNGRVAVADRTEPA